MRWTGIPAVPGEVSAGMAQFLQSVKNNLENARTSVDTLESNSSGSTSTSDTTTAGFPSITDYGAVGDGTTNNDAAFAAAEASSFSEIYVPTGIFKANTRAQNQFNKGYYGPGLILLGDGTAMPGKFSYLATAPTQWPVQGTTGFFRTDSNLAQGEWHVIGPGTRKSATARYFEEAFQVRSAWLDIYDGSSGFDTEAAYPRTHSTQDYIRVRSFANGDNYGSVVRLEQRNVPAVGQTHIFGGGTVGAYGGDMNFIGSSGSMGTGWEMSYHDQGNDVGVFGQIDSYVRDNAAGARSAVWIGLYQKSEGAKPADACLVISGRWRVGVDTVKADLSSNVAVGDNLHAAINTALGQRWIMNSQADLAYRGGSPTWGTFYGNKPGDMYIESGNDGSDFIAMRFNRASPNDGRLRLRQNALQCNVQVSFAKGMSLGESLSIGSTAQIVWGPASGNYLEFNGTNFRLVKGGVAVATW